MISEPATVIENILGIAIVIACIGLTATNIVAYRKSKNQAYRASLVSQCGMLIYSAFLMIQAAISGSHVNPVYTRAAMLLIVVTGLSVRLWYVRES